VYKIRYNLAIYLNRIESYAEKSTLYYGETLTLSQFDNIVVNTAAILSQ